MRCNSRRSAQARLTIAEPGATSVAAMTPAPDPRNAAPDRVFTRAAALSFTLMLFILIGIFLYARLLGTRNLTEAAI